MPVTTAGTANTSSADQVRITFRPKTANDCIEDSTIQELQRRIIGEIDVQARNEATSGSGGGTVQAGSGQIAVGAQTVSFSWADPFPNTNYSLDVQLTNDPGAPVRMWISGKTVNSVVVHVVGHTNAVTVAFVASPNTPTP